MDDEQMLRKKTMSKWCEAYPLETTSLMMNDASQCKRPPSHFEHNNCCIVIMAYYMQWEDYWPTLKITLTFKQSLEHWDICSDPNSHLKNFSISFYHFQFPLVNTTMLVLVARLHTFHQLGCDDIFHAMCFFYTRVVLRGWLTQKHVILHYYLFCTMCLTEEHVIWEYYLFCTMCWTRKTWFGSASCYVLCRLRMMWSVKGHAI